MEIIRAVTMGRFTMVQIKEDDITAIGISRRSDGDKTDKKLAFNIALGRAKKALEKKLNEEKIEHLLMG